MAPKVLAPVLLMVWLPLYAAAVPASFWPALICATLGCVTEVVTTAYNVPLPSSVVAPTVAVVLPVAVPVGLESTGAVVSAAAVSTAPIVGVVPLRVVEYQSMPPLIDDTTPAALSTLLVAGVASSVELPDPLTSAAAVTPISADVPGQLPVVAKLVALFDAPLKKLVGGVGHGSAVAPAARLSAAQFFHVAYW